MKKADIMAIIDEVKDFEVQRIREDSDMYDFKFNGSQFIRFRDRLERDYESVLSLKASKDDENLFKVESKDEPTEYITIYREFQEKVQRGKDIKIVSDSKVTYSLKLIYHLNSDDKKEYRIYLSYKDISNRSAKIKRIRLRGGDIKKVEKNLDKMKAIYNAILKLDDRSEVESKYAR